MTNDLQRLVAASALIVTLERIIARGLLPESEEADARRLIVRAGRAFQLATLAERPLGSDPDYAVTMGVFERPSNVIDLEDATLELVRQEMGA